MKIQFNVPTHHDKESISGSDLLSGKYPEGVYKIQQKGLSLRGATRLLIQMPDNKYALFADYGEITVDGASFSSYIPIKGSGTITLDNGWSKTVGDC